MKLRTLATIALALSLCACMSATYTYTRTSDGGCTLVIRSARDLAGGFAGSIKRCNLIAETASATGGQFDATQLMAIATMLAPYIKQQAIIPTIPSVPSIPAPVVPVEQQK